MTKVENFKYSDDINWCLSSLKTRPNIWVEAFDHVKTHYYEKYSFSAYDALLDLRRQARAHSRSTYRQYMDLRVKILYKANQTEMEAALACEYAVLCGLLTPELTQEYLSTDRDQLAVIARLTDNTTAWMLLPAVYVKCHQLPKQKKHQWITQLKTQTADWIKHMFV